MFLTHHTTASRCEQVLDGLPISASEQVAAKSRYAGRLTQDFLEVGLWAKVESGEVAEDVSHGQVTLRRAPHGGYAGCGSGSRLGVLDGGSGGW